MMSGLDFPDAAGEDIRGAVQYLKQSSRAVAVGGFCMGTGVGIAFLANGLLPLVIAGCIAVFLPAISRHWRTRGYGAAFLVAVLAAAPWIIIWPVLLYRQAPALFHQWLWDENIGTYLGSTPGLSPGTTHYFEILPWYAFPAWILAIWTLWRARGPGLARPGITLPIMGFAITLAFPMLPSDPDLHLLPARCS